MRYKLPQILCTWAVVVVICLAGWALAGDPLPYQAVEYLEAHDGDTITAVVAGKIERIRLIGIDCPELKQEWGVEAGEFTAGFCGTCPDLSLELDKDRRDRYGRLLAYVWCGKKAVREPPLQMLNEALVIEGLAVLLSIPPNYKHRDRFRHALANAKKYRTGFWSQGGLAMTPRAWRKSKKSAGFRRGGS